MSFSSKIMGTVIILVCAFSAAIMAAELPVIDPATLGYEQVQRGTDNEFSIEMIQQAIEDGDDKGLRVDFGAIETTLEGEAIDPKQIYGTIWTGPYPFEQDEAVYSYKRFRKYDYFEGGTGLIRLFDMENSESPEWVEAGVVAVRMELFLARDGRDWALGLYDTFAAFRHDNDRYLKAPTIYEGPFVNLIRSDDPTTMVISFKTDREVVGTVSVASVGEFQSDAPTTRHEIPVTGLQADRNYTYRVTVGDLPTKAMTFRTAPKPGQGTVRIFYAGDSREGEGGGERNFMGVNHYILDREVNLAYQKDADLIIFGGDLIDGYTTSKADFRTQLHAWKQTVTGFMNHRPVYPAIGNHESLLNYYYDENKKRVRLDQWPYATNSAEAVFAEEFINPDNGPTPSDPRRPPYGESVYSFQYGPVKCITFNNNYWVTWTAERTGGSPEAYIMPDQMAWIRAELEAAEANPTVKYVLLYAQEPVFPNGGHVHDAMWYHGDNSVRAYTHYPERGLVPAEKGMIEVRNEFVRMVGSFSKVAAVLTSDEHNFSKVLIDRSVPVGDVTRDDSNGNQIVCEADETCSPLDGLTYPVWYMTCGGAGAPYYAQDPAPWNEYWAEHGDACPDDSGCFAFSSQYNFFLFEADAERISVEVWSPYGELIHAIEDLMTVKQGR